MTSDSEAPSNERGAVLVHVALALIALMSFSTFVVDYGVLWLTRRQAQNAADGAALAGAIGLAYDNPTDFSVTGPASTAAYQVLMSHPLFGQQPVVNQAADITFPPCPDDGSLNCVQVWVYRDAAHGTPLPMIFGQLVGLNQQGVRAMAIAKVAAATATNCLKPWAVIDRWNESWPQPPQTWGQNSLFDKYMKSGSNIVLDPSITAPDSYVPPTPSSTGSGLYAYNANRTLSNDIGMQLKLTMGSQNDFQFGGGWFGALALNGNGASVFGANIKGCVGITYQIGDVLNFDTEPGLMVGPTRQAVETDADSLVNSDPTAVWDTTLNGGKGGVANSAFAVSPRVVAVPLVDPEQVILANQSGRTTVPIANIMGFFVEGYDNSLKAIVGRLTTSAGLMTVGTSGPPIGPQSGFLQAIILVR